MNNDVSINSLLSSVIKIITPNFEVDESNISNLIAGSKLAIVEYLCFSDRILNSAPFRNDIHPALNLKKCSYILIEAIRSYDKDDLDFKSVMTMYSACSSSQLNKLLGI